MSLRYCNEGAFPFIWVVTNPVKASLHHVHKHFWAQWNDYSSYSLVHLHFTFNINHHLYSSAPTTTYTRSSRFFLLINFFSASCWYIINKTPFLERGFGVPALVSKWDGDFAPVFWTLRFYPYFLETKVEFAPILWKAANGVKIALKRPVCPCEFAPTIIWVWWFYPCFE